MNKDLVFIFLVINQQGKKYYVRQSIPIESEEDYEEIKRIKFPVKKWAKGIKKYQNLKYFSIENIHILSSQPHEKIRLYQNPKGYQW